IAVLKVSPPEPRLNRPSLPRASSTITSPTQTTPFRLSFMLPVLLARKMAGGEGVGKSDELRALISASPHPLPTTRCARGGRESQQRAHMTGNTLLIASALDPRQMLYYNNPHDPPPSPPRAGASAGDDFAVDPAAVRGGAAIRGGSADRADLGRGHLGDGKCMSAQLEFRDLTLGYDRHPAVHHLDGAVKSGALMAVVGPNGAGKSTLFKGVVGAIKPLSGRIERAGLRPQDIAYLPQAAEIDRTFPISVFDMVAMGMWRRAGLFGGIGRKQRQEIDRAIAAVGLLGFEERAIGTLSGGQMQRMLFARLLLQDARVIVLDEPFNAIDAKTSADLIALVRRWHAE